ncbi:scavenger receptor activity protein [Homalodisca vitripennis]|nr:scavenger receptor activity protein [Homalodisca vitripennis]
METNMQPKKSKCASKLKAHALLLTGLGFLILSVTFPSLWTTYYRHLISSELKMTPDSVTFEVWKDNPVPIYIEFFFFNWTNRGDLEKEGSFHIPQLQELGPYRFT